MAIQIRPPTDIFSVNGILATIFLAGSIEQGKAEDWQTKIWKSVKDITGLGVLNPRRKEWDSSWKQERGKNKFTEQVEWELEAIENSDLLVMYFDPATKSPISLLELGLISHRFTNFSPKAIVCCPEGFWRKGNVDIVCHRYGHKMVSSLEELIEEIKLEFAYLSDINSKEFDTEKATVGWNKGK